MPLSIYKSMSHPPHHKGSAQNMGRMRRTENKYSVVSPNFNLPKPSASIENTEISVSRKITAVAICLMLFAPIPTFARRSNPTPPQPQPRPSQPAPAIQHPSNLLHRVTEVAGHVVSHGIGHAVGHAIGGSAGGAVGGLAAALLHPAPLGSEQETIHVNQQLDRIQQQRLARPQNIPRKK